MSDCTVYIDEAGDLGFNRGTRWFILSAVIVDKSEEPNIRKNIAQIKNRLNVHELHLRKITDYYKRAYIVKEINRENFVYMNIIVDTSKLNLATTASSATAYNYICRLLLERVSWFLRDSNKKADIMLSARGTSRDGELIEYIKERLMPYGANQVVSGTFEKITAKQASTWDMLQLADVCATTMFLTYEVNGWGFRTPCFSRVLQAHLYQYNNRLDNYGIKYFDASMKPDRAELESEWPCHHN